LLIRREHITAETTEDNLVYARGVVLKPLPHLAHGDCASFREGIAIDPATDGRKDDGPDPVFGSDL
jgi:hypothetical protein